MKKYILNKYVLILIGFAIWMYFFDDNSFLIHKELRNDVNKYESSIDFYKKEIEKDKKILKDYDNPEAMEKFAREIYQMKKDSEDVFIIQIDSINNGTK